MPKESDYCNRNHPPIVDASAAISISELKNFLDTNQYTMNGILRYEWVFGRGFVSAGGRTTTDHCVDLMSLRKDQPGQRVLDVGCGIGGSAFYIAKNFGASVYGVDLRFAVRFNLPTCFLLSILH